MDERVRSAARKAERSSAFRRLARGGYAASGVIHALIGVLILLVAFRLRRGQADQIDALEILASTPFGLPALWLVAALLFALGLFHLVDGFALYYESKRRRWGRRLAEWGQSAGFVAMGCVVVAVALGARPDPDESAQQASRGLLDAPGGIVLLVLVGLGVAIAGVAWVVMGIRRSFRARLRLPAGWSGRVVSAIGAVGFVAKGSALLVVGALLTVAAFGQEPRAAGSLDAAVQAVRRLPMGEALMLLMGCGFVAYGFFCFLRARFAKL